LQIECYEVEFNAEMPHRYGFWMNWTYHVALWHCRPCKCTLACMLEFWHELNWYSVIHYPHLLVRATSERFLPAGGTFRATSTIESHWLQPLLVLSIHLWPAPTGVGIV
jgi:hypothetical protein